MSEVKLAAAKRTEFGKGAARRVRTGQQGVQVVGQRLRGGVAESEGGRQAQTGQGVQPVAEFDGGQRVEADGVEPLVRTQDPRPGVAEDGRGLRQHHIQK